MKTKKQTGKISTEPTPHVHHADRKLGTPKAVKRTKNLAERENEKLFVEPIVNPNKP